MATKSEQARADAQRKGPNGKIRAGRSKPGTPPEQRSRRTKRAGAKATYAIEGAHTGRPSRKSTRAGANRSKPDANLNIREEDQKTTPEARAARAIARTIHPRGKPARP